MATKIIPGVDVRVIREIVPPLPTPSGILALVGLVEKAPDLLQHVSTFADFKTIYGKASGFTLPEAKQAFQNGIFEVVVSPVAGGQKAQLELKDATDEVCAILEARVPGSWANNKLGVTIDSNDNKINMTITYLNYTEIYKNLNMIPGDRNYFFDVLNRQSQLIVATDPNQALPNPGQDLLFNPPSGSKNSYRRLVSVSGKEVVELMAKDSTLGTGANSLYVDVIADPGGETVTLRIKAMGTIETYENVSMNPQKDNYLVFKIQDTPSSMVTAIDLPKDAEDLQLPVSLQDYFKDGLLPSVQAFQSAIERLEKDPVIDLVLASTQDTADLNYVKSIYASVNSHCISASESAHNRIGIGGIPSTINDKAPDIIAMAGLFNSERFVLTAPSGVSGTIAGLLGKIEFYQSPTFKTLNGIVELGVDYSNSDLRKLIMGNVLAVDFMNGKGFIVVKGIDTTGGQISVTRVADRAVRRVKAISDQFIGTLNTEDSRNTLRQRIIEYFIQLENNNAIVPSTDGKDPSFLVDVYSSQADFAQGIVRVDIAIRPVRSIDYIYATILVKI